MPRLQPQYTLPVTETTKIAVIQGQNNNTYPVNAGDLGPQLSLFSQKVGEVTFSGGTFSASFGDSPYPSGVIDFVASFIELPDDVNPTITGRTETGFSGTYLGDGSGTGSFSTFLLNV